MQMRGAATVESPRHAYDTVELHHPTERRAASITRSRSLSESERNKGSALEMWITEIKARQQA
jgi:hypothetical protein